MGAPKSHDTGTDYQLSAESADTPVELWSMISKRSFIAVPVLLVLAVLFWGPHENGAPYALYLALALALALALSLACLGQGQG